ncbi:MAG: hypothetical protein HFF04_07690 [Oscillospiraceae bacterium]|nr:hypothetical protein [Oscillospiraceae bacterium]
MKKWKECPVYVWIFSFFALFLLFFITMFQFLLSMQKLFQRKFPFDQWFSFLGEFLIDFVLFFILPNAALSATIGVWIPELWNAWLGFLCAYFLGLYPAVRLWAWRKEHK